MRNRLVAGASSGVGSEVVEMRVGSEVVETRGRELHLVRKSDMRNRLVSGASSGVGSEVVETRERELHLVRKSDMRNRLVSGASSGVGSEVVETRERELHLVRKSDMRNRLVAGASSGVGSEVVETSGRELHLVRKSDMRNRLVSGASSGVGSFGSLILCLRMCVLCVGFLWGGSWTEAGWAAVGPPAVGVGGTLEMLSAEQTASASRNPTLGLRFRLQPGWKMYWRRPGIAGYGPRVTWLDTASPQPLLWPTPRLYALAGERFWGYAEEVVLPFASEGALFAAAIASEAREAVFRVRVEWLLCKRTCVPRDDVVELVLPLDSVGHPEDGSAELLGDGSVQTQGDEAAQLAHFLEQIPRKAIRWKVAAGQLRTNPPTLHISIRAQPTLGNSEGWSFGSPRAYLIVEDMSSRFRFGISSGEVLNDTTRFIVPVHASGANEDDLVGRPLRLTLVSGDRGETMRMQIPQVRLSESRTNSFSDVSESAHVLESPSLWAVFVLAISGGLILQLMPCVLPVLSLKLLTIASTNDKRATRYAFLLSAVGIFLTSAVLGSTLSLIKSVGIDIGWGIQFQQPWFLGLMALLLLWSSLSFLGFWSLRAPQWLLACCAGERRLPTALRHLLQGVLCVLLATSCSAPVVGTVVGFAFSQSPVEIFVVFSGLAVGLAAPWLLAASFPGSAGFPSRWRGSWSRGLEVFLAMGMLATIGWLIFVLMEVRGGPAAVLCLSGLLLLACLLVWRGKIRWFRSCALGMAVFVVSSPYLVPSGPGASTSPSVASSGAESMRAKTTTDPQEEFGLLWETFSLPRLRDLVGEGRVVLVDATASWCLTCQVNAFTFGRPEIEDVLADVHLMRADWTRPDVEIAGFLHTFGRYGVPLTAVFGPGAPEGVLLPALFGRRSLAQAVDRAKVVFAPSLDYGAREDVLENEVRQNVAMDR